MRTPWTMAPLAVDSLGDRISERFLVPAGQSLSVERRVGVMAEHALQRDGTAEILLVGAVIPWTHSPGPAQLAVPTHREFNQLPLTRKVEIRARMVTRTNHIVDLLLDLIGLLTSKANLI